MEKIPEPEEWLHGQEKHQNAQKSCHKFEAKLQSLLSQKADESVGLGGVASESEKLIAALLHT